MTHLAVRSSHVSGQLDRAEDRRPRTRSRIALDRKSTLLKFLPVFIAVRKTATTGNERDNIGLLLASIYLRAEDSTHARFISQRMLDRQPDSATAVAFAGRAYSLIKDWAGWKSLLDAQITRHPNDRILLLQSTAEAEAECDFPPARRALRIILDSGYALADDYNMFAGLSLFDDQVDRARRKRGGASTPIRGNVQRPP
jgi:hypothetical protein